MGVVLYTELILYFVYGVLWKVKKQNPACEMKISLFALIKKKHHLISVGLKTARQTWFAQLLSAGGDKS
jgi:hypothetical protein